MIVQMNMRRRALGALAVLAAVPALGQEPLTAVAGRAAPLLFGFPAPGPAAVVRLNRLFDAAPQLPHELVVPVLVETPAYRRTFKILTSHRDKTDRYDDLISKYARKYRLDARFLKSIMAAESEFDSKAVSPAGARGLMQVMPVTAEGVGVRPRALNDPESGIKAGAAYIQFLFRTAWRLFDLQDLRYTEVPYWVMQRVVAAYHAGPRFLTRSRWFSSTRAYVRKVVLYYRSDVTDLRRAVAAPKGIFD